METYELFSVAGHPGVLSMMEKKHPHEDIALDCKDMELNKSP